MSRATLARCTSEEAHGANLLRATAETLLDVAMTIAQTGETEDCDWIIARAELRRTLAAVAKIERERNRKRATMAS